MQSAMAGQPRQIAESDRRQNKGFGGKALSRADRRRLADIAVEGEAHRQQKAEPDRGQGRSRHHGHTDRRHADRQLLRHAQTFLQQHHADHHIHQRIEEIAKAGGDDMMIGDGPDIGQPVDGDQHGAERHAEHGRAITQRRAKLAESARRAKKADQKDKREEDAICNDLNRADDRQQLEIQGQQAPQQIGAKAEGKAAAFLPL